jgi:MoaA/NifB/PqqE/SkfB family radical SAM enzyme
VADSEHLGLFSVGILSSSNCNIRCKHCLLDDAIGDDMPSQTLLEVVSFLVDRGVEICQFSGFEPLCRPDFPKLMKSVMRLPLNEISVATNGCLIDDEMASTLAKAEDHSGKTIDWIVSIDGASSRTHGILRGEGNLELAMRGIERLKKTGRTPNYINTMVHRENVEDLEMMAEQVKALGARTWSWFPILPVGRGRELQHLQLSRESWTATLRDQWKDLTERYGLEIRVHGPICEDDSPHCGGFASATPANYKPYAVIDIGIDTNGDLYPFGCLRLLATRSPAARIADSSLHKAFETLLATTKGFYQENCCHCPWDAYCCQPLPLRPTVADLPKIGTLESAREVGHAVQEDF